ncbi:MAG TPA: Calx-beta domain-containing protein [Steroidobacteraceae bacterium]|nr:Calx-beta domain-containing protein [Steroidobacteraceae bacterium]
MKSSRIGWIGATCLFMLLGGCGEDGETVESTGGDQASGPGGASQASVLQFSAPSISVGEAAGTATVTINRTSGSDAVSVSLASRDGSATQPEDYSSISTTVSFAAGDSAPKTAMIEISDDPTDEPDETFFVVLTAPSDDAILGPTSEVLVTITDDDTSAPGAPKAVMRAVYRHMHVDWSSVPGATRYRLMKDPTGNSGFVQIGADLPATATSAEFDVVPIQEDWLNARYVIAACNEAGCTRSNALSVTGLSVPLIGYLKASNPGEGHQFGNSIALSDDGNTLAVGAPFENSAASGIDGNQVEDCASTAPVNCAPSSGAVYVYTRSGTTWSGPVYVKAPDTRPAQYFGYSIALSLDGNTLAVGAPGDGDGSSGAAYVYTRSGSAWSGSASLSASDSRFFGLSIAVSREGNTLAVGAPGDAFCDIGSDTCSPLGAVYVYTRSGSAWSGPDYADARLNQLFGYSLALSHDGNTLAVGAPGEDRTGSGTVYVYTRSGLTWSGDPVPVKASNTGPGQFFGFSVALSQDGSTLAAGAPGEGSATTGIDGDQVYDCNTAPPTNCASSAGAVYVYTRSGSAWSAPVYVKASNTGPSDRFGSAAVLNRDGSVLAVGAPGEFGGTAGLANAANDASNDELPGAGAVYVYTRTNSSWTPTQYAKASNPDVDDGFGWSLALDAEGSQLAVGAAGEDGGTAGFNGNEFDDDCGTSADANCADGSGAVYIY